MLTSTLFPKSFASDNHAGVHPKVLAAVAEANAGDAPAYGADPWTQAMEDAFRSQFGARARAYAMFNGTGANVVGLGLALRSYDSVLCPATAHINTHECGAAERILGAKLIPLPTDDGKITADDVREHLSVVGNTQYAQPRVISISQVTECGTVYTADEISELAEFAHSNGLFLHMDGARLANAAAELGCPLRALTTDAGVDLLSFGGTKNGALGAEALVVLRPELDAPALFLRKQGMQLASKMRFVSAQLTALLTDDLWRENAAHANAMAHRLADGVTDLPGVSLRYPVQSNAVFPALPEKAIAELQQRYLFHTWDASENVVRWMAAFDTTPEHIDTFVADIRAVIQPRP
ncbi:threonine aldolase [Planomonospora parontospora subsp. parontospora]|uniref:Threonine aldolase n=2 Tax=Planomonospora parontospora TaxID=58119 RepID=A0AA37F3T4_9ACTN|nr:beta-eliminating lyase-related protein [Planomonospora parontospora]GGK60567.1 threonine aldolase [Planomonospora parontospora]GII08754.1 threonine aldolase [Planomonospora parontospora subsp. parontospora]